MTTKYFNVKQGITTGNITLDAASGNITNVNWITANYFSGSGNSLSNIQAANITGTVANANYAAYAGNVVNAAQPNITSLGTLTSLVVGNATANVTITAAGGNGTLTATANITAPYFIGNVVGNISGNIVVPGTNTSILYNNSGNAGASSDFTYNDATKVATLNGNLITNNANLGNAATANYFIGNLWGTANTATTAGTVTTAAQPNITSLGTLTDINVSGNAIVGGNLVVNGNTTYVNVETLSVEDPIIELGGGPNGGPLTTNDGKDRGSLLHYYTTAPVDAFMGWDNSNAEFAFGSNVSVSGEVVTFNSLGNVRASYFIGNGSQLTGVAASTANSATTAGTVTTNAQPNITSVGTLTSLSVSGNVTASNFIGVFANGTSNVAIPTVNGNVNISSAGNANVVVISGSGANITGTLNVTANANVGNLGTGALVATTTVDFTTTSNVALGSVANVSITGGSAGYLLSTDGTGELSWIAPPSTSTISNGSSNVNIGSSGGNVTTSVGGTSNVFVVTATGANLSGTFNATGNANVGNIGATNGVFTNVTGNGSGLSSINGANVTGTVANATTATTAGTVTTAAQPNITSVGTLTSLVVSGNTSTGNLALDGGLLSNRANVSVSTSATVIDQFAPATYRTAKYVISASNADGYQSVETLLIHNGTTSYITVYGSICSNATVDTVEISSDIDGVSGNVRLLATSSNGTATVNLVATYLKT
jgi:hypothetical protein